MKKPQFLIAAPSSHSGKTTLTLGLLRALHNRGLQVQPFKCGPDYIDTTHHTRAARRQSINLDTFMMSEAHVQDLYSHYSDDADVVVTEGVMGLYDGAVKWEGSSAAIALLLDIPVILVVNAKAMAYSVAPLLYGLKNFNTDVKIAGVIFNFVNTESHYQFLKDACGDVGIMPLGYIPVNEEIKIPSRHLGLALSGENDYEAIVELAAAHVSKSVDIDGLLALTEKNRPSTETRHSFFQKKFKIAVARDEAFNFIYAENIRQFGDVTYFSPIHDTSLPEADLLYLAGGYPELYLSALQQNLAMRKAIRDYCENGGRVIAECGGMMYLGNVITDQEGTRHDMCGVLDLETSMVDSRLSLGYRKVKIEDAVLKGHEFHYSHATSNLITIGEVQNARGKAVLTPIYRQQNVLASYIHFYWGEDVAILLSLWNK
ncbi:cobyrinate a,c-diamide synthase [[Flexibacter] sp. ATCC 35208]|uniref:cobyrinate a,c-diamide synthase n=1 Tax=[Flexibacter] sp. ATCC 35208 TaxID=1936242 RepID=UPI0009CE37BF|nr:cobyrinate a,c-diamide synthase [[Flexibacter] sp. ATCC 35208]OMP76814.1 cobyrinic acid a,c-diamide synthase [[Flexibacter] sp. ATCC 35208]